MPSAAIRFLKLIRAIRDLPPFCKLDEAEAQLLDDLIALSHENQKIRLSDLMSDDRYPSPSTAYRRVNSLRQKGFVNFEPDPIDRRIKFVRLAKISRQYVELLDAGIGQISQSDVSE